MDGTPGATPRSLTCSQCPAGLSCGWNKPQHLPSLWRSQVLSADDTPPGNGSDHSPGWSALGKLGDHVVPEPLEKRCYHPQDVSQS